MLPSTFLASPAALSRVLRALTLALFALGALTAHAQNSPPTINDFTPQQGPVGTTVVINGTNFVSPITVIFGGNVSTSGSITSTRITVNVPVGAQTGPIRVSNPLGSATSGTSFVVGFFAPKITSTTNAEGVVNQAFNYQITADGNPVSFNSSGLPPGLTVDNNTGAITGTPTQAGTFSVTVSADNATGSGVATVNLTVLSSPRSTFFNGQTPLDNGVYFLQFATGNPFGYYSYLSDASYIYHFDLGYEYVIDANDGQNGVYLYDFASNGFFYTSPAFPFPYLYDFNLISPVYYFPDPNNFGRFNTGGVRYFYVFNSGQVISM